MTKTLDRIMNIPPISHHYSRFDTGEDILPIEATLPVSVVLKVLTSGQDAPRFIAVK